LPVLDTEILFALNPKDRKHEAALGVLKGLREDGKEILVPDTAMLEFQIVLKSIDKEPSVIRAAILALRRAIEANGGREVGTIDSGLIAEQCEIEEKYGLTYFDSLIAASALRLDGELVSGDRIFDGVPGINRIPLSS
jgi:predicted nucleic acid-binding protein